MRFKIFLLFLFLNLSQAQYKIAFIPFENLSDYRGKWNLSVEIPKYLGDFVLKLYGVEVLPMDSVLKLSKDLNFDFKDAFFFMELNRRFGVSHIIFGKILTFKISRFMTGFPLMAGYEAYNSAVEVEAQIFNAPTGESDVVFGAIGEVKERGLGLTLLGKPTEKYSEFYSLDLLKFGSAEFNETIVGEAMKKMAMEFALRLKKYIPEIFEEVDFTKSEIAGETELKSDVIEGVILVVGNQGVYVNLGKKDGIISGMILYVFENDEKIGEIEVVDVVDEHFSSCKVIKSSRELKKGDKVMVRVVK